MKIKKLYFNTHFYDVELEKMVEWDWRKDEKCNSVTIIADDGMETFYKKPITGIKWR